MAVHFVRAAPQQHQSAARPETVHSTHHHHRPYWLSLIFLIFNYQSPTSCTMFVQSPGKYCITTYIITESGRDNRFLPAPTASYPEFVQSHVSPWQAKYSLLPSCHHQFHPVGGQTGEVRTEFSGVSQLLPGSLTKCWGWSCDTHPSLCDTQPSLCDTHSSLRDTHSSLCETHLPHTPYHTISEQSLSSDLGPYEPVSA